MTTEFLRTISHELRTPLSAILGYTDLLRDPRGEPLSATQATDIEQISRNGQQLLRLVNELIDLSRCQAGAQLLAKEEVELGTLVTQLRAELVPRAAAKGLTLTVDVPATLPPVSADPRRLK